MSAWLKKWRNELCLFLMLLSCYGYFFPRWASWSQNSRMDLILAIVDQGTLSIDSYYENTGDYAFYRGHYYSDKAPGLSFLGVPVYAVFKGVAAIPPVRRLLDRVAQAGAFQATLRKDGTGLQPGKVYFAVALYFVTFFTISIPAAVLGVLLYSTLAEWGLPPRTRFLTSLVYGLATPAFAYGGMLFSHQLVAFLVFLAFYLVFQSRDRKASTGRLFITGVLMGWAIITEYPAALIAAGVGLYTLWLHRSAQTALWIGLGALLPGTLLMAYDWAIFGTVLPKGYLYSVNYQSLHGQGLVSITHPRMDALWGITFGSFRGLFFLSPILLLSIAGFVIWWRRRVHRAEWVLSVWAIVSFLLFVGSSIMWQGGFAVGPRYLLPMLPFLALGLGIAWQEIAIRRGGGLLLGLLMLWSAGAVWLETISGQSFPDWTPNPLFNYSWPRFAAGDIARNLGMILGLRGHLSLLPLAVILLGLGYFAFADRQTGEE